MLGQGRDINGSEAEAGHDNPGDLAGVADEYPKAMPVPASTPKPRIQPI